MIGTYCGQQRNLVIYSSAESIFVQFATLQRTADTQNRGFAGWFEFSERFVNLGKGTERSKFAESLFNGRSFSISNKQDLLAKKAANTFEVRNVIKRFLAQRNPMERFIHPITLSFTTPILFASTLFMDFKMRSIWKKST